MIFLLTSLVLALQTHTTTLGFFFFSHIGSGVQTQALVLTDWKQGGISRQPWVLRKLYVYDPRLTMPSSSHPRKRQWWLLQPRPSKKAALLPRVPCLTPPPCHGCQGMSIALSLAASLLPGCVVTTTDDTLLLWNYQWGSTGRCESHRQGTKVGCGSSSCLAHFLPFIPLPPHLLPQ